MAKQVNEVTDNTSAAGKKVFKEKGKPEKLELTWGLLADKSYGKDIKGWRRELEQRGGQLCKTDAWKWP